MDNVVARYFEMWNTGDTSIADEVLHPSWTDHAHPEVAGPAGVKRSVEAIRAARPDLTLHIDSIIGEGDLVAVVGSAGRPSTPGPPGDLLWLIRLTDGLMAEMWTYQQSRPAA